MPHAFRPFLLVAALFALAACRGESSTTGARDTSGTSAPTPASGPANLLAVAVQRLPHDPAVFTEGLELHGDTLYESSGLEGKSFVQATNLATGALLRRVTLPAPYFGEGITVFGGKLYWLTWKQGKGFVYDAATFAPRGTFTYDGEGWGLTHDSTSLIMSDGTSTLRWLDPATLKVTRRLVVTNAGQPVEKLNELEWVKGVLYANVWESNQLVRIDPATGHVTGWVELGGLLSPADRAGQIDVANGIAYDAAHDRLFVTGKYWPAMFEVRLQ